MYYKIERAELIDLINYKRYYMLDHCYSREDFEKLKNWDILEELNKYPSLLDDKI